MGESKLPVKNEIRDEMTGCLEGGEWVRVEAKQDCHVLATMAAGRWEYECSLCWSLFFYVSLHTFIIKSLQFLNKIKLSPGLS